MSLTERMEDLGMIEQELLKCFGDACRTRKQRSYCPMHVVTA